jgi:hypothetical protein
MAKKTFQEELKETILNRTDPNMSKHDVLCDIFKTYTVKMLEQNVLANKNRLESKFLTMIKAYLISEFRNTELGEDQMSEAHYEEMFDSTIKGLFNDVAHAHSGVDTIVDGQQELLVDRKTYDNEIAPKYGKGGMVQTAGGLWVPR